VQFAGGERVLISSCKQGLRISKLLFGMLPTKRLFDRPREQPEALDAALLHVMDWDGITILDKLVNRVLACENIAEVEHRFRSV